MLERSLRRLRAASLQAAVFVLPLLTAVQALAVTDKRAVQRAASETGPAIPEPSAILLFALGVAIVGFGFQRIRKR